MIKQDSCTPITRIGYADPTSIVWQGARPHGTLPYGTGGKTVGQWGCPLMALWHADQMRGGRRTIAQMLELCRKAGVWDAGSSLARLPLMARTLGFACPDTPWMTLGAIEAADWVPSDTVGLSCLELSLEICGAIEAGGFAWLCVDHTGDDRGDHWVLAYAFDGEHIHYVDSATKKTGTLLRRTLSGVSVWAGTPKAYAVVRAYGLG